MSSKTLLSVGAVILFLIGLVLLFFAFVFFTAVPSAGGNAGTAGVLGVAGLIFLAGGAALVYAAMRGQKTEIIQQVKIDLPGDTKISQVTCATVRARSNPRTSSW
jgi:protein-S-isoprenylcysteine O-methyltransferase Ste14